MPEDQRDPQEVLADAVRVLTEAARLRRPVMELAEDAGWQPHPTLTDPADWAEFVTLAVAGAVANVGGVERALAGRPGSWEADSIRNMVLSTVGVEEVELWRHRTEPLRVVVRPAEVLVDLGYAALYDESSRLLQAQQDEHSWTYRRTDDGSWLPLQVDAPPYVAGEVPEDYPLDLNLILRVPRSEQDQAALEALEDQEIAVETLQYELDPQAYGAALMATVLEKGAALFPGVEVEVVVDTDLRRTFDDDGLYGPEDQLLEAAQDETPLPWSGIAPRDYPAGQSIVDVERAAGRLPHLRLDS